MVFEIANRAAALVTFAHPDVHYIFILIYQTQVCGGTSTPLNV